MWWFKYRDVTFLYVIYCEHRDGVHIKIGISKNPQKRLKQLQTGNISTLKLFRTLTCFSKFQAAIIEKHLHNRFSDKRSNGEWFHYDKEMKQYFDKYFDLLAPDSRARSEDPYLTIEGYLFNGDSDFSKGMRNEDLKGSDKITYDHMGAITMGES